MTRVYWLKYALAFSAFLIIVCLNLSLGSTEAHSPQQIPPSQSVRHFVFGYTETFGDSLWLSAIQSFTGCEQNRGGSATTVTGAKMGIDRTPTCHRGWLFHILSLLLDLLPRFHYAARVGPVILSAVVDDIEGATIVFEKALRNFPDDWVILTRAGYHYVFELEDYRRGAQLYYQAAKLGAPAWMALYASKLTDSQGRKEMAKRMVRDFMSAHDLKPGDKIHFINKLKELEK